MPVPAQTNYPLRRPAGDLIVGASWIGGDEDLALEVQYYNAAGQINVISFQTRHLAEGNAGVICLPTGSTINDVAEENLAASLRMAAWIDSAIPGSAEFRQTFEVSTAGENAKGFQCAAGTAEVQDLTVVSDGLIDISFKIKGQAPVRVLQRSYAEFVNYAFQPQSQLWVIPGSIKIQFPSHVHNYPTTSLSASQKQDILDYVSSLAVWC